ncbi:SoxR reducing system RseC family protein [Thermoanaerobacterium sp. DL9XJH110]|uniref:SoxR reducing system RseC family protein n=1 Tax=Thermoanaerobacterium sp. DL9XJH110 TaxID=3386643 RepID=UPI003BB4ED9B
MRERAVVVESKGKEAKVSILRSSACDHCRGCAVGTEKKALQVWVKNPVHAKVGQTVEIELETAALLTATFMVYVVPLIAFLVGVALGYKGAEMLQIRLREVFALFSGLAAMGLGFLAIHFTSKDAEKSKKYTSSIVSIIQ